MAYQTHKIYGSKNGMGFQFNHPYEGCVFDIENQRYCFFEKGLSDEKLLNNFVETFHYARHWLNKQWKPIDEITTK